MSGRPNSITQERILEVFRQSTDHFLTAKEVAEELDVTRQAVNPYLKRLRDEGKLNSKRAGSRAVGWWLAEDQT